MATPAPASFAQLLEHAVNEPGILSSAYRQFYGYSLGNRAAGAVSVHGAWYSAWTHRHVPTLEGIGAIRAAWREGHHAVSARHRQAHHDR